MKAVTMCCVGLLAFAAGSARAENGVTADEILIGQTMPYSGPLSGYSGFARSPRPISRR